MNYLNDASNNRKEQALLDEALSGKSREFKEKVLRLVETAGLNPNDPMFLLLISTGRLEVMLEQVPEAMERLFNGWSQSIHHTFDLVDAALLEKQKLAITQAAGDVIKSVERQEQRRFFGSLVPATGVLLAAIGFGFAVGITVPPYLAGGYVEEVKLTEKQASLLRWAESREGKFARDVMNWNAGYVENLECLKDVKKLKIVLHWGSRTATEGFCALWVRPPEKRRFKD